MVLFTKHKTLIKYFERRALFIGRVMFKFFLQFKIVDIFYKANIRAYDKLF